MHRIIFESPRNIPTGKMLSEIVERKGIGHPDTMCDSIVESASVALCGVYLERFGRVLHHNIDKGLLIAGQTAPALGGGRFLSPMRLIFGDRATAECNGVRIPIGEIVENAAKAWLKTHMRGIDADRHFEYENAIQPGSAELVDIFSRIAMSSNDTSAAVGYAPLTETERLVLAAEHYLNSSTFKTQHPEVGEDIKVMAVRHERTLSLTISVAFVDRWTPSLKAYFENKHTVTDELQSHLLPMLQCIDHLEIALNTLDDPSRGNGGMYLTVLGTSAEGADSGQVGRGNRVNGVISLHRPMSTEAAAGKNPVSHVGKIYNLLAHRIAGRIVETVPGVEEATVWLCSQIGRNIADPWSLSVELLPKRGVVLHDLQLPTAEVFEQELSRLPHFIDRLCRGEVPVC